MILFDVSSLRFCCGVNEVGDFWNHGGPHARRGLSSLSGTGLFVSTFVDSKDCKDAYELFKKEHKLLFQSEPYKNIHSENKVFLCVYLHKDTP